MVLVMAGIGITGGSAVRTAPPLTRARTAPLLSSFLGFRLCLPDFSKSSLSSASRSYVITARFGGGFSSFAGSRRSRQSEPEFDPNQEQEDKDLDMSAIKSDTVRLIDQEQNMVGVVSMDEAQQMAEDAGLDLVIVSSDADPPVVKIMNYDKYRYLQQKKIRDQQKKSSAGRADLKVLRMGYNIDVHDYAVRLKAARKFFGEGHKVKIVVNLKGRQNIFRKTAIELLARFQSDVAELATEEVKNLKDKNIYAILVPNKAILQKGREPTKEAAETELESGETETETESEVNETAVGALGVQLKELLKEGNS